MKVWHEIYRNLITKKNIFRGYKEFLKGKKSKRDVITFGNTRNENLRILQEALLNKTYKPGTYSQFLVRDPKTRIIHKAQVVDRIVHHIVSNVLEKIFEPTFIFHSYSCRKNKGTHKGVIALQKMAFRQSRNNTRPCWILKCDIRKFFASINHEILMEILEKKIKDQDFLNLLKRIVDSFYSDKLPRPERPRYCYSSLHKRAEHSKHSEVCIRSRIHPFCNAERCSASEYRTTDLTNKKGIPIGNLTSQFFSNIYLNEFDQFAKHTLKLKYYVRYADDFAIISSDRQYLLWLVVPIQNFLKDRLDLDLHPKKIILRKFSSGVDYLGYVIFPKYILPRTKTRKRLIRKIRGRIKEFKAGKITEESLNQTIQSYYGFLAHANTYKFKQHLQNLIWFWLTE